jgi:hypothetical protein
MIRAGRLQVRAGAGGTRPSKGTKHDRPGSEGPLMIWRGERRRDADLGLPEFQVGTGGRADTCVHPTRTQEVPVSGAWAPTSTQLRGRWSAQGSRDPTECCGRRIAKALPTQDTSIRTAAIPVNETRRCHEIDLTS